MLLKNAPIRRRLTTIILLPTGAVLLLTCGSFFTCEFLTFKQTTLENLLTLGEVVANNSTGSLAFANQEDGKDVLGALKANRDIQAAALYDINGKLFSQYPENRPANEFPLVPENDGQRFGSGYLISFQPVVQGDRRLGTLYLKSDKQALYDRFQLFGYITLAVVAASLLLAYPLSRGLQRRISEPILALAKTAQAIADHHDYSVRAPRTGEGEFALLTGAFNQMLTQIHEGNRALSESEERFRSAMFYSAVGMALVAPDGRWLDVNQSLCLMLGYASQEMLGQKFHLVLHPDDVKTSLEYDRRMLDREIESYRLEERYLHKDGHVLWVDLSVSLVWAEDGTPLYFIAQIQDSTERKRDEELLRSLNVELEQRVEERTRLLNEANKDLERFTYSVAHDLRAPLRAIDGFSRIVSEDYSDKLDEDGHRLLQVVRTNAQNMSQLIDDLLAFARLGRKEVQSSAIDMTQLACSVFKELSQLDSQLHPQLKIGIIPPALGDLTLIRQVFVNLLSNAMKYSRLKEQPVIEVGGHNENGNNVYFVKDNGAGFDMRYADKLFGVFQRLHGPEEFEGTGVGLAIVQRIIQRHGGKVWAEGKIGDGATFRFSLPRKTAVEPVLFDAE